jgi:hypothetical protein
MSVVEDISPTAEQVATHAIFLGGYGALGFRDGLTLSYAREVHAPIMARALYLEGDGGTDVLLLVVDAVPGPAAAVGIGIGNALPVVEAITAHSPSAVPMVFGLVLNSFGYYIPEDKWETGRNGDYEESVASSREAGDQLRDRLLRLIGSGCGRAHTSAASAPRHDWTQLDAGRLAEAKLAVLSLMQARICDASAVGGAVAAAAVQVLEIPEPALPRRRMKTADQVTGSV